jgi:integrase
MARIKFTSGRIRDFNCPPDKAQVFLWDADVPGLAVRSTPSGKAAFIFQAKLAGKDIRVTLGDVNTWGIDKARAEARRLGSLIDQGTDPRQEKQERIAAGEAKREEARRQDVTVGEAWAAYVEDRSPHWGDLYRRDHERVIHQGGEPLTRGRRLGRTVTTPGPLAALTPLPLKELTPERVKAWLQKESATRPTSTALAFRMLRAFVGWCDESPDFHGTVNREACTQKRVRREVAKPNSKAHDTMQREQLPAWFKAIRAIPNPVSAAYLQVCILTGARREEVLSLKWVDVDFAWNSLTIRDKVEGERIIPLTPYVAGLLRDLKARNETPPQKPKTLRPEAGGNQEAAPKWKPSPWVFSSPTAANGRIQDPRLQLDKACVVAGIPKLTIHGLRRTFKNMAEWVEVPAGVTAQLMGHKPSAIAERHYTSRPLDLLRVWHTKLEAWILTEAGIEQPKEQAGGLRVVKINLSKST